MRRLKTCIVFVICAMLLVPPGALAELYNVTGRDSAGVAFLSEAKATNIAPYIDDTSFALKIIAEDDEVYPAGDREYATIPFAFTGEDLVFAIAVTDDNGEEDIAEAVTLFLSDDESVDADDISLPLSVLESTKDGDVRLTFTEAWNVPSLAYGRKSILITATDSGGLAADNNGLKVGAVFINPQIGFEIASSTGEDIESIQFPESAPGTTGVSAQKSPIRIRNTDPDGVGMYVTVLAQGDNLVNQDVTGSIPIENMKVDGMPLSTELQIIDEDLAPDESNDHLFSIDYPVPLPAGSYAGTVDFEISAL